MTFQLDVKRGGNYNGNIISRVLTLTPGDRKPWILKAEQGAGTLQTSGIIAPAFGRNPDISIRVALTDDDLKEIALAVKEAVSIWSMHKFSPAIKHSIEETKRREAGK